MIIEIEILAIEKETEIVGTEGFTIETETETITEIIEETIETGMTIEEKIEKGKTTEEKEMLDMTPEEVLIKKETDMETGMNIKEKIEEISEKLLKEIEMKKGIITALEIPWTGRGTKEEKKEKKMIGNSSPWIKKRIKK